MMVRDLSSRGQGRKYTFRSHGAAESSWPGMLVTKPGQAAVYKPAFKAGISVVRMFPQPVEGADIRSPASEYWSPYRYSEEPADFGDWIRRYRVMRSFGADNPVTYIFGDPSDAEAIGEVVTPGEALWYGLESAIRNKCDRPGWSQLKSRGPNGAPALSRPDNGFFVQACLFVQGATVYSTPKGLGSGEKAVVFMLGNSAANALIAQLNELNPASGSAVAGDYEHRMLYGDPVSLSHGRFVTFYPLAGGDPRQAASGVGAAWQTGGNQGMGGSGGMVLQGHGCYLEPTYRGLGAPLTAEGQDAFIRQRVQRWDDILWFPTVLEQAELLATRFPPDFIVYAWRDHPEWIPDVVAARAVNATNVAMGGYAMPGMPGMPMPGMPGMSAPGMPMPGAMPAAMPVLPGPVPGVAFPTMPVAVVRSATDAVLAAAASTSGSNQPPWLQAPSAGAAAASSVPGAAVTTWPAPVNGGSGVVQDRVLPPGGIPAGVPFSVPVDSMPAGPMPEAYRFNAQPPQPPQPPQAPQAPQAPQVTQVPQPPAQPMTPAQLALSAALNAQRSGT